jgi:hypothetical protein
MYTINIGLKNPFTGDTNSVDQTLKAALATVQDITGLRVSYDGDEPTVIIDYISHKGSLLVLATALDQDCIAVYDHNINKGSLVGDKADAWGPFNIEYFQFVN